MSLAIPAARNTAVGRPMGDPGLFGAIWGGIKGAATGLVGGGVTGAIGGAARGFAGGLRGTRDRGRPQGGATRPPAVQSRPTRWKSLSGTLPPVSLAQPEIGVLDRLKAVGQSIVPGGVEPVMTNGTMLPPKGYKWNKSGYYLQPMTRSNPTNEPLWVAPGTRPVKIRRRNPGNSRANSRAIARVKSAKNMAKQLGRITIRETC